MRTDPSPLRILMITARSDIGGGPRHLCDLETSLSTELDLFTAAPNELPYYRKFKELSKSIYEIPKRKFSLIAFLGLLLFARKNRIELVHSHGRGAGSYSRLLRLFGFPVIHSFHGLHFQAGLKGKVILWAERLLGLLTTKFIAVSRGEIQRAIELGIAGPDRIQLIYNGIAPSKQDSSLEPRRSPSGPFKLGALTRFDPQKGNDILIRNFSALPKEVQRHCELNLVGEGPELDNLKSLVKSLHMESCIHFPGPTADPIQFLKSIDLYVSASRGEGLSYASLEALTEGVPLLLSDVTGHDELNGIPGVFFFPIDSTKSFQETLAHIIANSSIRSSLPEKFTQQQMVKKIRGLYDETLKTKPRPLE